MAGLDMGSFPKLVAYIWRISIYLSWYLAPSDWHPIPPSPFTRGKDSSQEVSQTIRRARMGYRPASVMGCSGGQLFLFFHRKDHRTNMTLLSPVCKNTCGRVYRYLNISIQIADMVADSLHTNP